MKQPQISDPDILRSLCSLIVQGKTDFDYIREFAKDAFFQQALGINRIPPAEILRQRFEYMSSCSGFEARIHQCSAALGQKIGLKPARTIVIEGTSYRMKDQIDPITPVFMPESEAPGSGESAG